MMIVSPSRQAATLRLQSQQAFEAAEFYSRAMPSVPVADKRNVGRQILNSLKLFFACSAAANSLEVGR